MVPTPKAATKPTSRTPILRLVSLIVAAALATVLTSCTLFEDDGEETSAPPQSPETLESGSPEDIDDAGAADTIESLGSETVDIAFIEDGELEMAVTEMEVEGELLRASITFTASIPDTVESVALGAIVAADEAFTATGVSPELIDPVNLKAYEMVAGGVPNGTSVELYNGEPHAVDFYFAAPEDDVETFDVVVHSASPAIQNVPVP